MHNIKQIRDSLLETPPTLFERFVTFTGFTFLYDLESFYNTYKERIQRSVAFARIGWLNYDFESQYLYELMAFKLKRVLYVIETYGHHIDDGADIEALKESIQICDRLFNNNYDRPYCNEHDKKWGAMIRNKTINNDDFLKYSFNRANAITKEDVELEGKEFLECFEKASIDRHNDLYRLAYLLDKHQLTWWD